MAKAPDVTPPAAGDGTDAAPASGDVRHNCLVLGADLALFMVALAFASRSTVLPAFAAHLGAPPLVIGAVPAVMTFGWLVPSLFFAGYTRALARKLPFVLRWTLWERVPFLLLALAAFFLAGPAPGLTLALLLLTLLVITGVGGVLLPAWMDIVGRTIPVTARGRLFAVSNATGAGAGLAGSVVITYVLAALPGSGGYGVCFLAAAGFSGLSYLALTRVREPASRTTAPAGSPWAVVAEVPALLGRDRNLAWFLVARTGVFAAGAAQGFFAVYALRAWRLPDWEVGVFTGVLFAGEFAGSLLFGWLADHLGHRRVLLIGAGATAAASLLALGAPSPGLYRLVFALVGLQFAATMVSDLPILLEFAPGEAVRPVYVGLGRTAQAPVAFVAPLLAGLGVEALGFAPVFAATALCGLAGLAVLTLRVREPRHAPPRPSGS